MKPDLADLGFRQIRRLTCRATNLRGRRGCDLAELWGGFGLVAVKTNRKPSSRVVEMGHEALAIGADRAPPAFELVVLLAADGSPARPDPAFFGVDQDTPIEDIDPRAWSRLALAKHGESLANPVRLWCSHHRRGCEIQGDEAIAFAARSGHAAVALDVD